MGPMKYETIYFDLDGTLTDSAPGITNSLMYALECMGRPVPPRSQLYRYVGPPLWDSFRRYEGMTQAEAQEAVGFFRSYYERAGKFENAVYPGIPALLEGLRARGKRLAVATIQAGASGGGDFAALWAGQLLFLHCRQHSG